MQGMNMPGPGNMIHTIRVEKHLCSQATLDALEEKAKENHGIEVPPTYHIFREFQFSCTEDAQKFHKFILHSLA